MSEESELNQIIDSENTSHGSNRSAGGNTCNPRSRNWFYTWNNHSDEDFDSLDSWCKTNCDKYQMQEETGEEGTKHIQGCMKFKNARTFNALHKKWPKLHLETARNWENCIEYCSKLDTRSGMCAGNALLKPNDPLSGKKLRDIQTLIIDFCKEEPDDRTIVWIYDEIGGAGKTTIAKHLCIQYPDNVLYLGGSAKDMKYGVYEFVKKDPTRLKIAIIDLTRSVEEYVSYDGIEAIKNGIFFNTKYESGMCIFNNPHVLIFSNFLPNTQSLSLDRWKIIDASTCQDVAL